MLTAKELAELLHVTVQTVYRWARTGKLPAVKIGTTLRFRREALEALGNDSESVRYQSAEPAPLVSELAKHLGP